VASKTAVLGMTRALAVEWGPLGIRVNAIAPGYIETDLTRDLLERGVISRELIENRTPLRRFGQPDDVVGATLFLLSPLSAFVTGATLSIDGGWLANGYIR
jgi:NAD(P)-dependent dehydrogenase (short-subunit alcohol dehydrogenase family)